MSSYLGNQPSYGAYHRQVLTGDGSTTTFTLDYSIGVATQILVSLDAIIQEPEFSYTVSGLTITFASAPTNAARIFILYLGRPLEELQPADGSVTSAKLEDNIVLPGTDSVTVPKGTTAQRGTGVAGKFRYNTDDNKFEGYDGSNWADVGGGATGASGNPVFFENDQNVTGDYTITTNRNAMSAGPVTIDAGVTVTIPAGSVWTIV